MGSSTAIPLWPKRLRISLTASTASTCAGTATSSQRIFAELAPTHRVFDAAEEVLRVAVLRRRIFDLAKLRVEASLILGQRSGHHDVEIHELVSAAVGAQVWHALSADADHLAVLRARRHANAGLGPIDRGNADFVSERRLRRRDTKQMHEIVAFAPEDRVLLEANE